MGVKVILLLQLFGKMCEATIANQEWIPYLMNDGVFQMEMIRAYIRRCDCNAVLSIHAIGINAIEVYIA